MSDSLRPHGLYSPGQNTGEGSLSLLQGIFPTQESNQGLLYCRWILYQLSYEGSPILKGMYKIPDYYSLKNAKVIKENKKNLRINQS